MCVKHTAIKQNEKSKNILKHECRDDRTPGSTHKHLLCPCKVLAQTDSAGSLKGTSICDSLSFGKVHEMYKVP